MTTNSNSEIRNLKNDASWRSRTSNTHQSNTLHLHDNTNRLVKGLDDLELSSGNSPGRYGDDYSDDIEDDDPQTNDWADDSLFSESKLDDDMDECDDDSESRSKKKRKPHINPNNLLTQDEKNKIAEENEKLIYYIAKNYRNTGIEYDELVGWAQIGFSKALNKYDKSKADHVKVTTFIMTCMQHEIRFNLRKQRAIMRSAAHISLDATVSYNNDETDVPISDGVTYSDIIKNGGELSYIETDLLDVEKAETVKKLIARIPKREQAILILSFGLFGYSCMTQEEIGEKLNMSQANVSKVKGDALKRMGMILELECRREQRRNNKSNTPPGKTAYK
jgi:RNA polymerase sporulation-specific sigma factor